MSQKANQQWLPGCPQISKKAIGVEWKKKIAVLESWSEFLKITRLQGAAVERWCTRAGGTCPIQNSHKLRQQLITWIEYSDIPN